MSVTLTQVIDPAQGADQFTTPDNGNRFVGAVFRPDPGSRPYARITAKPRKPGRKHYPQSPCRIGMPIEAIAI